MNLNVLFGVVCSDIYCIFYCYGEHFKLCVPPCPRYIKGGDTHKLCVHCLGVEHAQAALKGEQLPLRKLCCCMALFDQVEQTHAPCGLGLQRLRLWELELAEELEMASAFSQPSLASSSTLAQDTEARSMASSTQSESPMLGLSSSEEIDVLSIEVEGFEDSPPLSPSYEELLEAATRAVVKLLIGYLRSMKPLKRASSMRASCEAECSL